jgi:hypothetical protein
MLTILSRYLSIVYDHIVNPGHWTEVTFKP